VKAHVIRGAGRIQAPLVGEVPVDSQPLHPGALGDGADGRRERSDRQVQLERRFDDPPSRLGLPVGALAQPVGPLGPTCRRPSSSFQ
jgi:hypothetical protein